jgi:NAD(P)-dependent dehydrogenase (short-subunit alcohol dehydrogenase family)
MLMVKHFVELLRASDAPAMVNIGSVAGRVEWPDHFLYSCTKAGIEKYTQHLVRDLPWIRSNCVIPGFIDTSILDGLCAQEEKAGLFKVVEETLPCGRMGHPDDIAKAILFLTSADADYINGASLVVDGGFLHSSKWLGV